MKAFSISKFEEGVACEDAVRATPKWIAVSDGAGGGGVFADRWSEYLVAHLPDSPMADFTALDQWVGDIWEPFYDECEAMARKEGGMLLNKFYDEGSFATLVAVWDDGRWMTFGDSVAFCFDVETGRLQHTFGRLAEFNNPPYLINCKDSLEERGFKAGQFCMDGQTVVLAASDALAHYILMMYQVWRKEEYMDELQEAMDARTKNSNFVQTAMATKRFDFQRDVLQKLLNCRHKGNFGQHIKALRRKGLIGHDDYSMAIL